MGSLGQILNKGGRKERLESEKSDSIMALNLLSKLFQPVAFFFFSPFLFFSPSSVHFLLALTSVPHTFR